MLASTQPAPTLEEAESLLPNIDPRVASILRRRMGLAPVEPEPPKVEPAPETSALAALREQLADLAATVPAIDPEALQRLDAEIAEKAKAEQGAQARAEQEAAKVAKAQSEAVTAALEPIKARARALSPVKRRMIESSVKIRGEAPDDVIFQHSVFCQTVLPYRDPGPDVRFWERQQGQVTLSLEAGRIRGPEGRHIPVGLPFGVYARRALLYLNTTALRTRDRTIDVDGGVTAFTRRILRRAPNGREIHQSKDALSRLSGCNVSISYDFGDHAAQVSTRIVSAFDLWEERHETECCLAPKTVMLSADYFDDLMAHAVPLDERAIAALAHSVMGLDVYAWLAQRLHRVPQDRPQFIAWTALHAQFGQGYDRIRDFRRDFKTALNQVLTQYPAARVKTDKGGMLVANSPPPVPSRHVILLPLAKPPKG
jgi:hypothetical protein